MARTKPRLEAAVEQQRPEAVQEEEKTPNAMATRKRRGKHGLTAYFFPATKDAMRRSADKRGLTLEELIFAGVNKILAEDGEQETA